MNEKLKEYARMLVQVGMNIQKGQRLVISSPVECAFFARMCAEEAYAIGCKEVVMNWHDDAMARLKYLYADDEIFDTVPKWREHFFNDHALEGAAYLAISASDPENFKGVDHGKLIRAQQASGKALKDFDRLQMSSGFPWCIASIPIPSWARRVFPGLSDEEAVEKLWDAIFKAVRITGDGKCVDRWQEHLDTLHKRMEKLNALNFKSLHYTNSLGTDLTIELPKDHIWEAGNDVTPKGQEFIANVPTEEIFTAPLKTGINGVVYSSMPLCHDGVIIDKFRFVVKEGKIVEAYAEEGEETIRGAIAVDEGASYFGEVALVPYDSPISNQKILFYNTLFDENAACHLAFGEAYPCIKGGRQMDKEQLKEAGLNDSFTHVDFMIGTKDLSIVGTTYDGREIPVFVDGNFAEGFLREKEVFDMAYQMKKTDENVMIAEGASVVGDVTLGKGVSIWYNAVLRGDEGAITVGENTNIQDGAILHEETRVGAGCTVGHNAIVHGCTVGDNVLIGMGAIVLNGAKIGNDCIVGAGALVTGKMDAPDGSMILGSPAKIVRQLTEAEIEGNRESCRGYLHAAELYRKG